VTINDKLACYRRFACAEENQGIFAVSSYLLAAFAAAMILSNRGSPRKDVTET